MINSYLSGLGLRFRPKPQPPVQELTEIRVEVPQPPAPIAAKPKARSGLNSDQVYTVFMLMLEHSDALLDALEGEKETWWDKVTSCFRRTPKENGALKYLLWASEEHNLQADRWAQKQEQKQSQGQNAAAPQRPPFRLNVNLRNHKGEYLILRAAQKGIYPNAIRKLIKAGARLDVQDKDGRTALMHTVLNDEKESALDLIAAGAKLDIRDKQGRNALTYALLGDTEADAKMAEAIVLAHEQHPDGDNTKDARDRELFQQKDLLGRIPLSYALENGFHEIADYLVAHSGDLNATDDQGISPLMYAALDPSDDNLVHTLVANGANVQAEDIGRRSPLIFAAGFGASPALNKLLELGAVVDHADRKGRTAIMYAARHKDAKVADTMLRTLDRHHADLDAQDQTGRTATMHAAEAGRTGSLKTLAHIGANFDMADNHGNTALMLAVLAGKPKSVKALCMLGADPNLKNAAGQTAYQIAKQQNDPAMLGTFYELQGEDDEDGNVIAFEGYDGPFADPEYDSDESEYSYLPF